MTAVSVRLFYLWGGFLQFGKFLIFSNQIGQQDLFHISWWFFCSTGIIDNKGFNMVFLKLFWCYNIFLKYNKVTVNLRKINWHLPFFFLNDIWSLPLRYKQTKQRLLINILKWLITGVPSTKQICTSYSRCTGEPQERRVSEHCSYEESELGLFCLEKRRFRRELSAAFQSVKGTCNTDGERLFISACSNRSMSSGF